MTVRKLISALRSVPADSRKASLDVYDLCVEAAAVLEIYQRRDHPEILPCVRRKNGWR